MRGDLEAIALLDQREKDSIAAIKPLQPKVGSAALTEGSRQRPAALGHDGNPFEIFGESSAQTDDALEHRAPIVAFLTDHIRNPDPTINEKTVIRPQNAAS